MPSSDYIQSTEWSMDSYMQLIIANLIQECTFFSMVHDLNNWKEALETLNGQINYKFTKEEEEIDIDYRRQLTKLAAVANNKYHPDFHDALHNYQRFILKCFDKRHMLWRGKADARYSMLG